ncbi:MAG: glycosyltransferase family 1 protein [Hyphomicrobiaceae bacterium]|nr:glycosyltransferase family 1 protein [Hyphomicrobiaceae bacterium]MCC0024711.1 glycosyltransferase family 1 protein [Hyphomicrobiaceae bacterium]
MAEHLMIISDAWHPQTNGVVRTLEAIKADMENRGFEVSMVTPDAFWTVPVPTYPEIKLALTLPGTVAQLITRKKPDYIHIATEGPLGFAARMHCERAGLNFTTSYHTRFPEYLSARLPVPEDVPYAFLKWFHWPASAMLVPTITVANELLDRGFRKANLWTRGVETGAFHPGPKSLFSDLPGPHLLCVGRVAIEKNIEAFLRLEIEGSKIVVGDGPQLETLKAAYPSVHFLGLKKGADLRAAYQSADAFVFPSKTDTFGNVMLEALACGTPVAAYPVTGPIDVITDRRAGALDNDLGAAVRAALQLSRHDAHRFSQQFTWKRATDIFHNHLAPVRAVPAGLPVAVA